MRARDTGERESARGIPTEIARGISRKSARETLERERVRARERDCERECHFGMGLYDARMLIGGNGRKLARIGARGKGTEREHN